MHFFDRCFLGEKPTYSGEGRAVCVGLLLIGFGATLLCMIAGFSGSSHWPKEDLIGKWVLKVVAAVGFLLLAYRIGRRKGVTGVRAT